MLLVIPLGLHNLTFTSVRTEINRRKPKHNGLWGMVNSITNFNRNRLWIYVKSIEVQIQMGLICITKLQTLDQLKINRSFKQLLSDLEEQPESRTVPLAARWSNWAMDLTEQQGHLVSQSISVSWTGFLLCEWVSHTLQRQRKCYNKPFCQRLLAEPTALLYRPPCWTNRFALYMNSGIVV